MPRILARRFGPGAEMQRVTITVQRRIYPKICAKKKLDAMTTPSKPILFFLLALLSASAPKSADVPTSAGPEYAADGQLKFPEHYREWVYLTSDFHTATDPAKMQPGGHSVFNTIFVNPEAYKAFLETGTWPDKTMLVVEQRRAEDMPSTNPNHKGNAQSSVLGLAVHVKDHARFPGKWAFFGFQGEAKTSQMTPVTAACYSCHAAKAALDTTFVQFYPTLLPIAKSKGTLNAAYSQEIEGRHD
jgi:hypothetical protein